MTEFEKFKSDVIKRCAIEHDELKYNLELKFMADK